MAIAPGPTSPPIPIGGTPSAPTPPTPSPTPAPTPADQSAKGVLSTALANFGLGTLGDWAWGKWLAGESLDQIMLELRDTPEYKARFPAMEQLGKQGQAITEQQYIDYERGVKQALSAHGIDIAQFSTPDKIASYLVGNVSLAEVDRRLQFAQQAAYQAPAALKAEFSRLYGIDGPGAATAMFLDDSIAEPELEKRFTSAQIAAQADLTKFGQLSKAQAEQLAALGVTDQQAQQGFTSLGQLGDAATTTLPGEQALTQQQLLDAQFAGDAGAQQAIRARQAGRVAAFSGGGSYAAGSTGVSGAGAASGA